MDPFFVTLFSFGWVNFSPGPSEPLQGLREVSLRLRLSVLFSRGRLACCAFDARRKTYHFTKWVRLRRPEHAGIEAEDQSLAKTGGIWLGGLDRVRIGTSKMEVFSASTDETPA